MALVKIINFKLCAISPHLVQSHPPRLPVQGIKIFGEHYVPATTIEFEPCRYIFKTGLSQKNHK